MSRPDGNDIVPIRREATNSAFASKNEAVHLLFENPSGIDGHYDLLLPLEDLAVLNPKQADPVGTCSRSTVDVVDMTASIDSKESNDVIDLTRPGSATPMRSSSRSRSHSASPQKRRRESVSPHVPSKTASPTKRSRVGYTIRNGKIQNLPDDYVFPEDFPWPDAGGESPPIPEDSPVWLQLSLFV